MQEGLDGAGVTRAPVAVDAAGAVVEADGWEGSDREGGAEFGCLCRGRGAVDARYVTGCVFGLEGCPFGFERLAVFFIWLGFSLVLFSFFLFLEMVLEEESLHG
jgi:hypothetical protein